PFFPSISHQIETHKHYSKTTNGNSSPGLNCLQSPPHIRAASMADSTQENTKSPLTEFLRSGIYRLESANAVFLDPVRILNRNYSYSRVSPSAYYSRFFADADHIAGEGEEREVGDSGNSGKRKRKRKRKKPCALNDKELIADLRHQEARPLLVKAHEALLSAGKLLQVMPGLRSGTSRCLRSSCLQTCSTSREAGYSFIDLGKIWQAPLYEITLKFRASDEGNRDEGSSPIQDDEHVDVPIFCSLVSNNTKADLEAEFLGIEYMLPRQSCFYMSDLEKIRDLIPGNSDCGFNLIVLDPPWENRSAFQKLSYPTLPNRNFLKVPVKQLAHTDGALVALWVTNREKLRSFVENELFPVWGVTYLTTYYWMKVKADGSFICDLDLFHHRPYECLLLGYLSKKVIDHECPSMTKYLKDHRVIISIPGDYSRKPPVGELLLEYAPGPRPARCIELFARDMMAGWIAWGNEPLRFQQTQYFLKEEPMIVS
ncbi:Methyltransferase-like protein, partial [Drosera capensis]